MSGVPLRVSAVCMPVESCVDVDTGTSMVLWLSWSYAPASVFVNCLCASVSVCEGECV